MNSCINMLQVVLGMLLAAMVALLAFRLKTLNRRGALGAFLLGGVVFGFGGLPWASVLLVFFITSSALSLIKKRRKKTIEDQFAKGSRRDGWQVAANGGVAGLATLVGILIPGSIYPWVVFSAAFAAANADTWATELGVLSKSWPRSIRTFQPVPPGTSGGISAVGLLGAAGGAALIAFTAWLAWPVVGTSQTDRLFYSLIITAAGVTGSIVDSLIGATVQGIYWCPVCNKETEKHPIHICGNHTTLVRGWKWMNNDMVNLACTSNAALIAIILVMVLL